MKPRLITLLAFLYGSSVFDVQSEVTEAPSSRLIESYNQAKPLKRKAPKYPRSLAKKGQDGWVQLSFVIDEQGQVKDVIPLDYAGSKSFVKSAVRAVESWQYSPAMVDGEAIEQCSNSVQIDFALSGGAKVRGKFKRQYKIAQQAIEDKDFNQLAQTLENMDSLSSLNITELFWRNYLAISLYEANGHEKNRYIAINRTLSSLNVLRKGTQKSIQQYLLHEKFAYETENSLYAYALDTFRRIEKSNPELATTLKPYAEQIRQLVASDELIYVKAKNKKGGNWHHKLVRNEFAVADLDGTINKLEVRCDKKRSVFTFDINSAWKIPESWGQCSVFLDTEGKTKFTLVELNT